MTMAITDIAVYSHLSDADIAESMSISRVAVRTLASRGLTSVRSRLQEVPSHA